MDATLVGKRIVQIRGARGISQTELARLLGVTKHVVYHLEHGHSRITLKAAVLIAETLHCTIEDLLAPLDAPMSVRQVASRASRGGGAGPASTKQH